MVLPGAEPFIVNYGIARPMPPLQVFGLNPLVELVLGFVVSVLTVAFGTYVGVLMALQSFFQESSWQDVSGAD